MIELKKIHGSIKSYACKDAPSPAPSKAGEKVTMLHTVTTVIELDVTDCMPDVEGLFPMADAAIKLASQDVDNKGWTQTSKTKPGAMTLTVRASGDGAEQFEIDGARLKSGVQLHVSAQNQKKTNQGKLVIRVVGRFTDAQLLVVAGCATHDVKVWLSPSQKSFFDASGEAGKDKDNKPAGKAGSKAAKDKAALQEVAEIEAKLNASKHPDSVVDSEDSTQPQLRLAK